MSKMGDWQPEGYFDYVAPPLEGLWWGGEGAFDGTGVADKAALSWVSLIRQPDFVTPGTLPAIREMAAEKKPDLAGALESGKLRLVRFSEGRCAQSMHRGPYDEEGATISKLAAFIGAQSLRLDISEVGGSRLRDILGALDCDGGVPSVRLHHEIYLGDPRRTRPENLRTVIRHPVA